MTKQQQEIMARMIQRYGARFLMTKATEELAELIVEVAKSINDDFNPERVLDEVADSLICIEYLKTILGIDEQQLKIRIDYKLNRAVNRMKGVD